MTQLLYNLFYKQYGLRRPQSLLSPRLFMLNSLPRNSMLHILTHELGHPDIDVSKLYLKNYTKKIMTDFVSQLSIEKGHPRPKAINIRSLTREFFLQHKNFKYLPEAYKSIKDPLTLLVNNYNYLNEVYRYVDMPINNYYKWFNSEMTMWSTIDHICSETNRQHFVFIDIPNELPGINFLRMFSDKVMPSMLKIFDTPNKLFLLELWKWLNIDTRKISIFQKLNQEHFNNVNLVFNVETGDSCIINLGYLNSWITDQPNTTEFNTVKQFDSIILQKLFLRLMISLNSKSVEVVEQVEETTEDTVYKTNEDRDEDQYIKDEQEELYEDNSEVSNLNDVYTSSISKSPESLNDYSKDIDGEIDIHSDLMSSVIKDIDEELSILDTLNNKKLKDRGIKITDTSEIIEDIEPEDTLTSLEVKDLYLTPKSYTQVLKEQLDEYAEYGLLSAVDYKKHLKDIDNYSNMKDPYGSRKPIVEAMKISSEDIQLNTENNKIIGPSYIQDKSMLECSLNSFINDYRDNILKKDILSMTAGIQKAGVIIRRHDIDIDSSALGDYENHTIELKPIDGVASTLRFRLPVVQDDNTIKHNSNRYLMRFQRVDLPIRKINPNTVALSSYYGKTFITRASKKANSSLEYIKKYIDKSILDDTSIIRDIAPANVFDNNFKAPYFYSGLSHTYKSLTVGDYSLVFDYTERESILPKETLSQLESNDKILVGTNSKKQPVFIDYDNKFYLYSNNAFTPIGDIYTLFNIPREKVPNDFTEIRIYSKSIPIGVILGYYIGFNRLLKLLDIKYRILSDKVPKYTNNEYALRFEDKSYIFSKDDKVASLILSGFNEFDKQLRQYKANEFNNKNVYLNLLQSKGLGSVYIKEIDIENQLFIDPITESILREMGEPITFIGLLLRSSEMLLQYDHPDTQDMSQMRIRGYERLAGAIYKEMSMAIRQYRSRNIAGKSRVEMSPYQINSVIMKDNTIKLVEDINPIQNLKELEVITYTGEGGRGKDSMSKPSRAYHINDIGIVSEATVDSSDVGINAYMSANPKLANLRGISSKDKTLQPSNVLSTSALLAPSSIKDDPKRVNFITIQNSHVISTEGYRQPYIRTGYESIIPKRTTDVFCYSAKKPGKVLNKTKNGIIIEYEDGVVKGIALGTIYGKAEGSIYPHEIVSNLKVNDSFMKGDVIAYNTGFFEEDILNPKGIVLKTAALVKTALYESNQTFEDSSAISRHASELLKTKTTKVKSLVVSFKQNLLDVVKPGQQVKPKDILMVIEDEITSTTNAFDEESLTLLRNLSKQTSRSKYLGIVDKIEVYYHGSKEDMSPSLLALVERSDKLLLDISKSSGKPVISGQVNDSYRVEGTPLALDKAEIKIYITVKSSMNSGDKAIFASQLKSVVGEVMDYDIHTESGERVDAVFSNRGIAARIVNSPYIMGTTITLLKKIGSEAVKIYKG